MTRLTAPRFRIVLTFAFFTLVFLFFMIKIESNFQYADIPTRTGNILDNEPKDSNNIFLLYTNTLKGGIELKPRQACTIESAGRFL